MGEFFALSRPLRQNINARIAGIFHSQSGESRLRGFRRKDSKNAEAIRLQANRWPAQV